jgi:hypothetical protein
METETTTTALIVNAHHACTWLGSRELGDRGYDLHPERPQDYTLRSPDFATREEAEAWAAQFPKAVRFYVTTLSYSDGRAMTYHARTGSVRLTADAVNGGVNETGVRRYRSAIRTAAKLGLDVVFPAGGNVVNAYTDRAAFEAAIG